MLPRRRTQRGVTLIELMVGLAVGLVVTLVISQVLSVAEGQKRSTTSGSDAQVNGAVALYTVQRDLQMAGYGLGSQPQALGCPLRGVPDPAMVPPDPRLVPVTITDGFNGAPDTLSLLGSGSPSYSVPVRVRAAHPRDASAFEVGSALGVEPGDVLIAVPKAWDDDHWCTFFSMTDPATETSPYFCRPAEAPPPVIQIRHDYCDNSRWNAPPAASLFPADGVPAESVLLNLGPQTAANRFFKIYDVGNAGLQLHTLGGDLSDDGVDGRGRTLFPEIVNFQLYYGKDLDGDGTVDRYDNETPTNNEQWKQLRSVRVALVARSTQFEREVVTQGDVVWDVGAAVEVVGSEACGDSRCVGVRVNWRDDMAANDAWQHYHYKVFDTVVPLRNLMWNAAP